MTFEVRNLWKEPESVRFFSIAIAEDTKQKHGSGRHVSSLPFSQNLPCSSIHISLSGRAAADPSAPQALSVNVER